MKYTHAFIDDAEDFDLDRMKDSVSSPDGLTLNKLMTTDEIISAFESANKMLHLRELIGSYSSPVDIQEDIDTAEEFLEWVRDEKRKLIAYITTSVGDEYPSYTAKGKTAEQIEKDLNTMFKGDK